MGSKEFFAGLKLMMVWYDRIMIRFVKKSRHLLLGALVIGILGALGACSSAEKLDNDPAKLFERAQEDIDNDRYQFAVEKLRTVKNKFPYSRYSVLAKLRLADVYFLQESFGEAAAAYESFAELHPKHDKVPYALERVGESYYKDIPGNIARDLTSAQRSLEAYERFMKKFPTNARANEVLKKKTEVRNTLAEKQMYIGNWYLGQDQYLAALRRYKMVLEVYGDTKWSREAKTKLKEAEEELQAQKND